ncbi:hypothetical protein AAC387_Pa05g0611 [Persea americana]
MAFEAMDNMSVKKQDARILHNALSRPDPLVVPPGRYYPMDVSYANAPGSVDIDGTYSGSTLGQQGNGCYRLEQLYCRGSQPTGDMTTLFCPSW